MLAPQSTHATTYGPGASNMNSPSSQESHRPETLGSNDPATGLAAPQNSMTDTDFDTVTTNLEEPIYMTPADTTGNAPMITAAPPATSHGQPLDFSELYHSLEAANGWLTIPRPISQAVPSTLAPSASSYNTSLPPHPMVTQSLPVTSTVFSENGDVNSEEAAQMQDQTESEGEDSEYNIISSTDPSSPSSWNLVSLASADGYRIESLDLGSDDDEGYDDCEDESS
ncbi:hypothetical protein GMOD_00006912 [Pyrenophora seminiperda CCB06]|uniref:Uncharacterized protein n=1 Tax=Pyrenophora seminiperda CCB06 TaxID=1302712 RepID=A0A3M7MB58_9PLEO|nr:hypothetical protein GMOD_00006912 [Pyrenophora seminiperda CCB06]